MLGLRGVVSGSGEGFGELLPSCDKRPRHDETLVDQSDVEFL